MKKDFNKKFVNLRGQEIEGDTIADSIANQLFVAGIQPEQINNADKFKAYKISTKLVANNGVVELDESEIALLKSFCEKCFAAGAYGQIVEILEEDE